MPAHAILYQFSNGTSAFNGNGNITGSFEFDGANYSNISITVTPGTNTNFTTYTYTTLNPSPLAPVVNGPNYLSVYDPTLSGADSRYLNLQFSSSLTGTPGNTVNLVTSLSPVYFQLSNETITSNSVGSQQRGIISPGVTVTAVPFETDALPILAATLAFGGGVFAKKKLAEKKMKNLSIETANSEPVSIDA